MGLIRSCLLLALLWVLAAPLPAVAAGLAQAQALTASGHYREALEAYASLTPSELSSPGVLQEAAKVAEKVAAAEHSLQRALEAAGRGDLQAALHHLDLALTIYPRHRAAQGLHDLLAARSLDVLPAEKAHPPHPPLLPRPSPAPMHLHNRSAFHRGVGPPPPPRPPRPLPPAGDLAFEAPLAEANGGPPTPEEVITARYFHDLGSNYFAKGEMDKAAQMWRKALSMHATPDLSMKLKRLLTNQGLKLYGGGKVDQAIIKWQEALALDPDDQDLKHYLRKARQARQNLQKLD